MSNDPTHFRKERIEKLLYELRYEIERGIMEEDIAECLSFQFIVPISRSRPNSIVMGEFRTRPMPNYFAHNVVEAKDAEPKWCFEQ